MRFELERSETEKLIIEGNWMTQPDYHIKETSHLLSPSLIVFREILEQNLDAMILWVPKSDL